MSTKPKFTTEQIIEAIHATKGMVYLAAERLGCTPQTIYNRRDKVAAVREAMRAEDEKVNDLAELKLYQAIQNGEPWAVKYRLSTKGKTRGYSERVEVTGADAGPVKTQEIGRVHGSAEHVAAVIRILAEAGAVELRPAGPGRDTEDDELYPPPADG